MHKLESEDKKTKILLDNDGVHLVSGTNSVSVTLAGIVESGKKAQIQGSDDTSSGVLTKGENDFVRLLPPNMVTMQPQRKINIPIQPLMALIKTTISAVALGLALKAASK